MEWIKCSPDNMPKSEQKVIVAFWNKYSKSYHRTMAFYVPHMTVEYTYDSEIDCDYDEEQDKYFIPEGWYETMIESEACWQLTETITHWQPLPPAPAKEAEA